MGPLLAGCALILGVVIFFACLFHLKANKEH
jgi:uncharacterized membrane protein